MNCNKCALYVVRSVYYVPYSVRLLQKCDFCLWQIRNRPTIMDFNLKQVNPVNAITNLQFEYYPPIYITMPNGHFCSAFGTNILSHIYDCHHACYMASSSRSFRFNYFKSVWARVQITKFFNAQFSPVYRHFS